MTKPEIEKACIAKQDELLAKYFGNIVMEAAVECPETIGEYTKDLPLKIEAEYRTYLETLWQEHAPVAHKDKPLVLEEQKLRELMTENLREQVDEAYEDATELTLWERITKTNHEDVTYYKGLLHNYTRKLLDIMREDFLEEFTGVNIENKAFEEV